MSVMIGLKALVELFAFAVSFAPPNTMGSPTLSGKMGMSVDVKTSADTGDQRVELLSYSWVIV